MSKREDTAQKGRPLRAPAKKRAPKNAAAKSSPNGDIRGPAKTIQEGQRNQRIYLERLSGRSFRAIAMDFGLSTRRVHDTVTACEQAGIAELELNTQWRAERFAEERLMRFEEEINGARELELMAIEQNNYSAALGAFKQRVKLSNEYAQFLRAIGLMPGPGNIKFETLVAQLAAIVTTVFGEHGVPAQDRQALRSDGLQIGVTGSPRVIELETWSESKRGWLAAWHE
jgi:hypothetical protein